MSPSPREEREEEKREREGVEHMIFCDLKL